jgi:hypothetical protein
MRDQYAGDVSDVLKFAFLRALTGVLGIAWYYAARNDNRPDGKHIKWQSEPAWQRLDAQLHAGLSRYQSEASRRWSSLRSGQMGRYSTGSRCRRAFFVDHGPSESAHLWGLSGILCAGP